MSITRSSIHRSKQGPACLSNKQTNHKTQPEQLTIMLYVPIGLTPVQRSLIDTVVTLHKPQLLEGKVPDSLLNSIRLISNHPFLLVDHYMPKRLLLMETHESLSSASDLFRTLDKLITILQKRMTKRRVLIIGSSVKELDLVEAFILGRDLYYKRYSGMALYHNGEQESLKNDKISLLLVTKQQLVREVDLVLCLDQTVNLDWTHVPCIGLVSIQSPMHGLLNGHDKEVSVLSSLPEREKDFTKYNESLFGAAFENFSLIDWPRETLPEFHVFGKGEVLDSLYTTDTKKLKLATDNLDSHRGYQRALTGLTLNRVDEISLQTKQIEEKLKSLRIRSTLYHNTWDQQKQNIGLNFKQSQKLKEEASANELKEQRLKSEHEKYTAKLDSLSKELEFLRKLESGEEKVSEDELDKEIEALEEKLGQLQRTSEEQASSLDNLRAKYQKITAIAAEKSLLANSLKKQNEELLKELSDTATKLRQRSQEDGRTRYEQELSSAKSNCEFLERYNQQLNAVVKDRVGTLSIGRNGRVHRSTSQYV